jgi:hypothetical protein
MHLKIIKQSDVKKIYYKLMPHTAIKSNSSAPF